MENPLIQETLNKIKSSKKYKTISEKIIAEEIKKFLISNPKLTQLKKINKKDIKQIKSRLHRLYSSYQTSKKSRRKKYFNQLKQNPDDTNIINKILLTNISTKERLSDYKNLYKQIFDITGIPKTIIDLGCGLNPLSFPYMKLKNIDYYSYDIDKEDISFLNDFFKIMKTRGLNGKAAILDARNLKEISSIPSSDIIFIFKLIDLFNEKKKKISERLINLLIKKANYIIASFPTKTLSGKNMNLPRRKGFELMLKRLGFKFDSIKTYNEIFYVIQSKKDR